MNIKFTPCNLPLTSNSLKEICDKEKANNVILKIEKKQVIPRYYVEPEVHIEERIVLLVYHPNVSILEHDIFYNFRYNPKEETIIGYCPLVFDPSDDDKVKL